MNKVLEKPKVGIVLLKGLSKRSISIVFLTNIPEDGGQKSKVNAYVRTVGILSCFRENGRKWDAVPIQGRPEYVLYVLLL